MRKTPMLPRPGEGVQSFIAMLRPRPRAERVSFGKRMPSSHLWSPSQLERHARAV